MKAFKKISNILSTIIICVLLALALILIIPRIMGQTVYAVLSGSMEPEISVGSVVISEKIDPETLTAGQIVTYTLEGDTKVTHRVVQNDKLNKQLITKGDANDVEDGSPVSYDQVVGHAKYYLPYVGYVVIYIKQPIGIACTCALLVVLILLTFLPDILSKKKEDKEEE